MSDYTIDLADRVHAYRYENPTHGQEKIAAALGVSRRKVREALGKTPAAGLNPAVRYQDIHIPFNGAVPVTEPVVSIADPNVLVLADLHVPHHNRQMLARAIYVTRTHYPHVRQLAIIGDLFDFANISRHPHNAPEEMIDSELKIAGEVLRSLLKYFDRAYICNGNHDERLARKLDAHLGLQFLVDGCLGRDRPACEVNVTNLDYIYIDPAAGDAWQIGHPAHYSGQGGKTPADIADIEHRNVITGHNHIIGVAQSKSGRYVGIDIGHMTEPGQHFYQKRRMTRYPRWSAGFAVISQGYANMFWEKWTNWGLLGCA